MTNSIESCWELSRTKRSGRECINENVKLEKKIYSQGELFMKASWRSTKSGGAVEKQESYRVENKEYNIRGKIIIFH